MSAEKTVKHSFSVKEKMLKSPNSVKATFRELGYPRTGDVVQGPEFWVIGPNGQSPYDIQVELKIYRIGGIGSKTLKYDIDSNPFKVELVHAGPAGDTFYIKYCYHLRNVGWSDWYESGEFKVM